MQQLLSLHLHPVDLGAIALALVFAIALFWMTVRPGGLISQKIASIKARREQRLLTVKPRWFPARTVEEPVTATPASAVGPASLSPLEQLGMVIKRATSTNEQSRQAIRLTEMAETKLDAVERELLDLFNEVAAVSGYAQRRAAERKFGQGVLESASKPSVRSLPALGPHSIAA